jgi:hypothetical protein
MKMNNFFRGFDWWLFSLAVLAMGLIFCINLWFSTIPEIFYNASVVGDIFTALLCSYVAAYIFYLTTSYYQEYRDRKSATIPLSYNLRELLESHDVFVKAINNAIGSNFQSLDETKQRETLAKIAMTDRPQNFDGLNFNDKTWCHFLVNHRGEIIEKGHIASLYRRYGLVMENELKKLLSNIENSAFHEDICRSFKYPDRYPNLESLFVPMKEYMALFCDLKRYINQM